MNDFLSKNLWNLLVTAVMIITAFVLLQAKVSALELQANNLREKIAQYPSQDYFDLKFKTIEANLTDVKDNLKHHVEDE